MPVRFGIIGAGRIARGAVAPAIHQVQGAELVAVGSRSLENAKAIATDINAGKAHGSYEGLLKDPEVDAVYIGLPNGLHEQWTVAAANAGKHVLCEKSLTFDPHSAGRMAEACEQNGVLLMEAFMYRHHPQWNRVHEILASGRLGKLRSIEAIFTGQLTDMSDHRWTSDLGMGALHDLTCYGINVCRYLVRAEPEQVAGVMNLESPGGTDRVSHVSMRFPGSVLATAVGGFDTAGRQFVSISGTDARLEIHTPFIPGNNPARLVLHTNHGPETHEIPGANHFVGEIAHFSGCIAAGGPLSWPAENGLNNVRACHAAELSWRQRRIIDVQA